MKPILTLHAWFNRYVLPVYTSFSMYNGTDVYGFYDEVFPDPEKIIASVIHIESITTLFLDFYVTGGDAQFRYDIGNEGTFAPFSLHLRDMSTSTAVVDHVGAYVDANGTEVFPLLDGHRYVLSYKVSELGHDDDDISSSICLRNADVVRVSVAEPATLSLLLAGLVGLWVISGGGGADRDRPYCS